MILVFGVFGTNVLTLAVTSCSSGVDDSARAGALGVLGLRLLRHTLQGSKKQDSSTGGAGLEEVRDSDAKKCTIDNWQSKNNINFATLRHRSYMFIND